METKTQNNENKSRKTTFGFFVLILWLFSLQATAQINGDYRSRQNGLWGTAANWEVYNSGTGTWSTASTAPGSNIAIEIQSGHTITNGNTNRTVTGNTITVNGVWHADQATLTIGGTSTVNVNGELIRTGAININTGGIVRINDGGKFILNHNSADLTIPTMTWQNGSTCEIKGGANTGGTLSGLNQTFHHFVVNGTTSWTGALQFSGSLTTINGNLTIKSTGTGANPREIRLTNTTSYTLNIGGDLIIEGGTINLGSGSSGSPRNINIGGSFIQTGGTLTNQNINATVNFNGTNSEFSKTAGTLTNTLINWSVASGKSLTLYNVLPVATSRSLTVNGTINCITNTVTGAGTFTLNSGATLITAHAQGISSSGATGSIQVTGTRTFNTAANYVYNGTSAQITGNGLPATVNNLSILNTFEDGFSLSQNTSCNDFIVGNSSKFILNKDAGLTVNGNLLNDGQIHLESTSLGDGSLITKGSITNNGEIKIDRYLAANKWHLVSSPINNALSSIFLNIWLRPYNETANEFGNYITATNIPLSVGQGYSTWTNSNETRTFIGTPNTGIIGPISLQKNGIGWNLIGNPYPSAIDADAASGWTKNNVGRAIYIWDNDQYKVYLASDGIDQGIGVNNGSRYIAMGQGFFVQAMNPGANITLNNDTRVHNDVAFLKNNQNTEPNDIIRISVSNNQYSDETVFAIRLNAQDSYDYHYDAAKLRGNLEALQLYSLKDESSQTSICTYNELTKLQNQYVFLEAANQEEHILSYSHNINSVYMPLLMDVTNQTIIYPNTPYSFYPSENSPIKRFKIILNNTTSIDKNGNNCMIWASNKTINISNIDFNEVKSIIVSDISGRIVYQGVSPQISLQNESSGIYNINIIMNDSNIRKKLLVQ